MGGRGVLQGYLVQKAKVLRLVGQVGLDLRRRVMGGREVDGSFVCVGHYGISLVFVKDAILNVVYYPLVWGLTGCRNGAGVCWCWCWCGPGISNRWTFFISGDLRILPDFDVDADAQARLRSTIALLLFIMTGMELDQSPDYNEIVHRVWF